MRIFHSVKLPSPSRKEILPAHPSALLRALAACMMGLLLLAASASAYNLEKQVKKFTLANGLKVLIVERTFSPTVSLYLCHKAGAVNESSAKTGAAHFLEHMLFKGTKTIGTRDYVREQKVLAAIARAGEALDQERLKEKAADQAEMARLRKKLESLQEEHRALMISNEINRLYTENGAENLNASTGQDLTTYQVSLPANKLELWARIESDRMVNPVFREFYTERDVIMEERRQSIESDPDGKLLERFLAAAFIAHPYGRPIIGWPDDMSYLSPQDLESFLRRHHTPDNTVIAVVGNVKPGEVMGIIEKYFGAIPPGRIPLAPITAEPLQLGERRIRIDWEANPRLLIGYHKPTLPDYDDYVFDVIQTLLTDGRTSRLYKTLVEEKGVAEAVRSGNGMPGTRYPNLFTFYATPRHPHTPAELETALNGELERLKKEPVAARELEKAKNTIKADFLRSLNSNAGLAGMLSYFETVAGDYRYIINNMEIIDKITPEDILRTARKYFTGENKTVAVLSPGSASSLVKR